MAERSSQTSEQMILEAKETLLRRSPPPVTPEVVDPLPEGQDAALRPAAAARVQAPQIPAARGQHRTRPSQPADPMSGEGPPGATASRQRRVVGALATAVVFLSLGVVFAVGAEETAGSDPGPDTTVSVASTNATETPPSTTAAAPATEAPLPSTTGVPSAPLQSTAGSLSLMGAGHVTRLGIGGCSGSGDYAEIAEGAPLVVRDERGAALTESLLGAGRRESLSGVTTGCRFAFVLDLPTDRRSYVFEVGPVSYRMSSSALSAAEWQPEIRIDP